MKIRADIKQVRENYIYRHSIYFSILFLTSAIINDLYFLSIYIEGKFNQTRSNLYLLIRLNFIWKVILSIATLTELWKTIDVLTYTLLKGKFSLI